jgi:hypothetical protein
MGRAVSDGQTRRRAIELLRVSFSAVAMIEW